MALLRGFVGVLAAAWLVDVASAIHVKRQQVVMSATSHPRLSQINAEGSVMVNVTFDGIDLSKQTNQSIDAVPFLEFDRFQVVNATSAIGSGMLNKTDGDCAESSPNFVLSRPPGEYATPSVFRTDGGALQAAGLSQYIDLISFTVKPIQRKADVGLMSVAAWEIDEHAQNVYEVYLIFYPDENGAFGSFPVVPKDYFEGWGEKINYVEMSASTAAEDDDYIEHPWQFCLDDIVFEFREKDDER